MFLLKGVRVYLARQPVDLRKSIDGLSLRGSQVLGEDPFSAHRFVCVNRRRAKRKALRWDQNGFVLYYQRLERGHFRGPVLPAGQTALVIDARRCQGLLSGLSIEHRQALPPVSARVVA